MPLELKKLFYVVSFGSTTHLEPKLFHAFIQTSIWKAFFRTFENFESLLKLKLLVKTSNWNFFIEKLQHSYKLFCSWTWWSFKKKIWTFENFGALKNFCTIYFPPHVNIHKNSFTYIPHKSVDTQKVSKQFVVLMSLYSLTHKNSEPNWIHHQFEWKIPFGSILFSFFILSHHVMHFILCPIQLKHFGIIIWIFYR